MKTTLNEFIELYSKKHPEWTSRVVDELIETMASFNPNIKHFSRSDWYNIVQEDYLVHILENGITLAPKKLKPFIQK